jgi:AcrR family transcriptional regulator
MRNAEATRERILDAALAEFSAHGIAGARVDRISQTAGCNKNLIYIYFEDKETLFTTVLHKHLMRVHEESPFTPDDLPGYAGKVFDFAMGNPDLVRLLAWSTLEQAAKGPAGRVESLRAKVAEVAKAQHAGQVGTGFTADFLVTAVMTLAMAWSVASPVGPSINPNAATHPSALRKSVVEAIRLLANANKTPRARHKTKLR